MDTQFAEETTRKYHAEFLRLMDIHLPHGNAAYQELYAQMSGELQSVYGDDAGKAVSEAGKDVIGMAIEMTELAFPKIIKPID